MPDFTEKRTALLKEGFASVLTGNTERLHKTALSMSKEDTYWIPLLKKTCFENMTAEEAKELISTDDMNDVAVKLFLAGTPKTMLSLIPLGIIEMRNNPIERIAYKGRLNRRSRIASLLVVAGYIESTGFDSFEELQETLNDRAYRMTHPDAKLDMPWNGGEEETSVEQAEPEVSEESEAEVASSEEQALIDYHREREEAGLNALETMLSVPAPLEAKQENDSVDLTGESEATEEVQAEEDPSEQIKPVTRQMTVVPDVTDPEVYKELRYKVEREVKQDTRQLQWSALSGLFSFRKKKPAVLVSESVSAPRKITVEQKVSVPGPLPADTVIVTNAVNDDESRILTEEWSSVEELFAKDSSQA